ncbi:MAG TPA: lamin tail domain-containing protein [Actinomycetota bacterium]|nr:lamin tail domain-containing protein [Actinomycetota bacterium]
MPRSRPSHRMPVSVAAVLAMAVAIALVPTRSLALSTGVVISQVYGGGGNSGATYTHDFIELFNRGTDPVSLAGWSVQYASATGTGNLGSSATQLTELPSVSLQPGQYLLIREAQGTGGTTALPTPDVVDPSPIAMSATGGKVALVSSAASLGCNGGSTPCTPAQLAMIVDLVGWDGANFFEGSPAPATTNTTAAIRNGGGCVETDDNAADFVAGFPMPRNTAWPLSPCSAGNEPVVTSCGSPLPVIQGVGATREVTAADVDGTVVDIVISSVSPAPATGSITLGSLTPAGGPGETATAVVTVDGSVPPGTYTVVVTATNDDAVSQSGSCSLLVNVSEVLPIGSVQGVVENTDDGLTHRSPYAPPSGNGSGQTVIVRGVVYEKTLARTSSGGSQHGFFLQNTAATADGDPKTSDGIFVFMGNFPDLIGGYVPQVGDEVIVQGSVSEFFSLTELSSPRALAVVRTGVDLGAEVPAFETGPPDDLASANRYWERREGMRAQVPAGSIAVDGRDVFASTADAEVWVVRGDHPVAQRADPYERRAFRDPHPHDNDPALFDDGNGYRIIMGSLGIKAAAADNTALIAPARTFDTMTNTPIGGVYFSFSKYQIMVEQQLELTPGVDPSLNAPPQAFDRGQQFSLATYNVENLYDRRDDPFDGCDFTGNAGCPGVSPPFDYVPASQAAYESHLAEIAQQIVADLHGPDILLVQEAEDQDICEVDGGALACGTSDDADGKPDTLQELALTIAALGGPGYDAAYDRDGADDRGIVAGFLYRTDRVELLEADAGDPVLGGTPEVDYRGTPLTDNADVQNPKALNADLPDDVDLSTGQDGDNVFTRAPQVGSFRIWQDQVDDGTSIDLYAISNHFSSTPDARVGQRTEQALYNAAIVDALQAVDEDALVAIGGDLNVYPRPDDPFAPGHPLFPSDQLGPLYDQGLANLWDVLVDEVPSSAYSYAFQGQTQTLDQIFVTPSLFSELVTVRAAHVNADWPAEFEGDGARGASDHDPQVAAFCRDTTGPELTVTVSPSVLWPPNHRYRMVEATISVSDDADPDPTVELVSVTSNEPDDGPADGNTVNDIEIVDDDTFRLRAERSEIGSGRIYTITFRAADACGNVTIATATVTVPIGM